MHGFVSMHAIYILRASMSSYDGHVARSVRHSQLARGVVIHTAISSVAYSTTGGACLSLRVWPNEKRWCVNAWSARTRGVGGGPVRLAGPRGVSLAGRRNRGGTWCETTTISRSARAPSQASASAARSTSEGRKEVSRSPV